MGGSDDAPVPEPVFPILLMYVGMYRAVTGGGEFSHKDRRRLREID
jgi:hypothetical protein